MDYSNAINDLRFLENRFKNLIEIIPHLTELGSLENAIDEAKRQIASLKGDIESLGKDKATAEDALAASKKTLDNRMSDFDEWHRNEVQKVNEESKLLIQDAKDKAKALIEDAKAKADQSATAIKTNEAVLEDLKIKIASANDQYEKISAKLLSIKNSI